MLHPFTSVESLDSDISDIFAPMSLQSQPPGATKFEVVSSNEPTTTATLPDCSKLTVNDFDTLALLGRGDVGKVYLVHLKGAPENEHLYAMKVLDNADLKKRDKLSRLDTEKKILQTVHHPNIVALYGIFQDVANTYLLMEYCSCGEFFKFLQSQPSKCLPEVAVKFYAAEVLSALEYLHKIGVVYRDLKPEVKLLFNLINQIEYFVA
jgi:protein-serine/threonine kinase